MKNNRKLMLTLKYSVLALLFLLLYMVQTTPGLLRILGVKPILLIPAAVATAMYEEEFIGGIFGLFAGMLCDLGAFSLYGFYSILLLAAGAATGLIVVHWLHRSYRGALLITFVAAAVCGLLRFYFDYGLWHYEGISTLFLEQTLPTIIYTAITAPLFFWLLDVIERFFEDKMNR